MLYFLSLRFWGFYCVVLGRENAEIFVQNEYSQCLLLYIVNIVIIVKSTQCKILRIITLDFRSLAKIEDKHSRSRCSEIQPQKVDREKLLHRINLHRLVYIIIALMVNIIGFAKINLLILKRLCKSEQRIDVISEE